MVKQDFQLARRAVACKGWRWMPGMLAKTVWAQARVLGGEGDRPVLSAIHHHGNGFMLHHPNNLPCDSFPQANTAYPFLPDLTDPATMGCLLQLVREACNPSQAPSDLPAVCTYQSQENKWGVGVWVNESGQARFAPFAYANFVALVLPWYETEAEALVEALEAAP